MVGWIRKVAAAAEPERSSVAVIGAGQAGIFVVANLPQIARHPCGTDGDGDVETVAPSGLV
jgi:cation diffusion facilitator CzcD-associated flavoprotein CzcO